MALPTPTSSALSPSLARVGGAYAIAWMESDGPSRGRVHAGFAETSLADAAAAGHAVSAEGAGNARDARFGEAGDHVVLVWTEFSAAGTRIAWTWCR